MRSIRWGTSRLSGVSVCLWVMNLNKYQGGEISFVWPGLVSCQEPTGGANSNSNPNVEEACFREMAMKVAVRGLGLGLGLGLEDVPTLV